MNTKSIIWVGMVTGSTLGGYAPLLWGGSLFSFASIMLTAVGGMLGIYLGFQVSKSL
jgi:hypothetical protein